MYLNSLSKIIFFSSYHAKTHTHTWKHTHTDAHKDSDEYSIVAFCKNTTIIMDILNLKTPLQVAPEGVLTNSSIAKY